MVRVGLTKRWHLSKEVEEVEELFMWISGEEHCRQRSEPVHRSQDRSLSSTFEEQEGGRESWRGVCRRQNGADREVALRSYWNWEWMCVHWNGGGSRRKAKSLSKFSIYKKLSSVKPWTLSCSRTHNHIASSSGKKPITSSFFLFKVLDHNDTCFLLS